MNYAFVRVQTDSSTTVESVVFVKFIQKVNKKKAISIDRIFIVLSTPQNSLTTRLRSAKHIRLVRQNLYPIVKDIMHVNP